MNEPYCCIFTNDDEKANAYVSGLQADLNFHGDQLVDINAMYIAGAVIGQLPFTFLFPMFPMNYTIPALEVGWGIFTLLQYRAESFSELMAYRFFVGIFEVSCICDRTEILNKVVLIICIGCILSRSPLCVRSLVPWGRAWASRRRILCWSDVGNSHCRTDSKRSFLPPQRSGRFGRLEVRIM